jgi:hypothetical protein
MRKRWSRKVLNPQFRGERLELQNEDLLGGVFHNDNIKWCSRKLVSSSKKLNELRGIVKFWKKSIMFFQKNHLWSLFPKITCLVGELLPWPPTIFISSKLWVGVDRKNDDLSKILTCLCWFIVEHCLRFGVFSIVMKTYQDQGWYPLLSTFKNTNWYQIYTQSHIIYFNTKLIPNLIISIQSQTIFIAPSTILDIPGPVWYV